MKSVIRVSQEQTPLPYLSRTRRWGVCFVLLCCWAAWSFVVDVQVAHAAELQQDSVDTVLTVGTETGICAEESVIAALDNTNIHFCIRITNQTPFLLESHTIAIPQLFPDTATLTTALPPGDELVITTGVLDANGIDVLLDTDVFAGSTESGTVITYTSVVTSTGGGLAYSDTAIANVIYGQVGITVDQPVGTNAATCGNTNVLAVTSGTNVYFCVEITKTGDLEIEEYTISAPVLDFVRTYTAPLASNPIVIGNLTVTEPLTSVVTVTGRTTEGIVVEGSAVARVVPGTVAAALSYTVGVEQDECSTTSTLTVASSTTVYYCIQLKNNGTLPLVSHALTGTLNNAQVVLQRSFLETVAPGETMVLTRTFDSALARAIAGNESMQLEMRSTTRDNIPAITEANSNVTIGNLAVTIDKYARTDATGCVNTSTLSISTEQDFYYCVIVRNTGQVPFQTITVSEPALNINFSFDYELKAGEAITLNNTTLTTLNLASYLGPFRATGNINPTMTVVVSTRSGITTQTTRALLINASAPTATRTPIPTPSFTPVPTNTPSPTPMPTVPPTPTPTVVVPSILPTPTDATSLNQISTPVSGSGTNDGFNSPLPNSPLETPTATLTDTVNIFATNEAATLEAASAFTATNVAMTAIAVTAEAGTATAQALAFDATATAIALLPTDTPTPIPPTDTSTPTETPTVTETATESLAAIPLAPTGVVDAGGSIGGPGNRTASEYLTALITSVVTSTMTFGWIWFLMGSIVFFAVAGMFAGLSFRQQERDRFDMHEVGDNVSEPLPLFDSWEAGDWDNGTLIDESGDVSDVRRAGDGVDGDDFWPASLR